MTIFKVTRTTLIVSLIIICGYLLTGCKKETLPTGTGQLIVKIASHTEDVNVNVFPYESDIYPIHSATLDKSTYTYEVTLNAGNYIVKTSPRVMTRSVQVIEGERVTLDFSN